MNNPMTNPMTNPRTNIESARYILFVATKLGITAKPALKAPTAIILKRKPCRFERRIIKGALCPTKEGDMIYLYDKYRICFSVDSKGHLRNHENQVDVYAWTDEDYANKAAKAEPVGVNAPAAIENLDKLCAILADKQDIEELREWFGEYRIDHEMVFTKPEWRQVIVVTPALYEAGVTTVINAWSDGDDAPVTKLNIGDVIVVESTEPGNEKVYRIEHHEFIDKHPAHAYLVQNL